MNTRAREVEKPVWSGRARPKAPVGCPGVTGLVALQRAAGNRAVAGLVAACRPTGSGRAVGVQRMIAVNGSAHDYAIMKQVQQLMAQHQHKVVILTPHVDLKGIGPEEKLYIVSHGDRETGDLKLYNFTGTDGLVSWLTHQTKGLPRKFGGIVVLSCYSGLRKGEGLHPDLGPTFSLAERIAAGIKDHVDPEIPVEGAKGYSFGSPELKTGHSSVLPLGLEPFYSVNPNDPEKIKAMKALWLNLKPTHAGGVLKTKLGVKEVDTTKTIEENLSPKLDQGEKKDKNEPGTTVIEVMTNFAKEALGIEGDLRNLINEIGEEVKKKYGWSGLDPMSDYFKSNPQDSKVVKWNTLITEQFDLFQNHYLWSEGEAAFQVVKTAASPLGSHKRAALT